MMMFRPTKKRPKPRIVRTRDDDDGDDLDEDDNGSPDETTVKRPLKKKARPAMSFNVDDDEKSTNKKKKRKRGMGFGGAVPPAEKEVEADTERAAAPAENAFYGQDALNKLKAEQRYKKREEQVADVEGPPDTTNGRAPSSALPSYIPLSGSHVILTGDEAMEYETQPESAPLHTTTEDTVLDAHEAEEYAAWEAQVASRAGVHTTSKPTQQSEIGTSKSSTANLTKLREQVTSTISQLKLQTDDIQHACARRQVEVTQSQEELTRQETELQQAGTALEYYQALRQDLASWVGALRELRSKVMPLQETLHKVERIGGNRWTEWQDDIVSILREAGVLDRVLGRQPLDEQVPVTTGVDEFGRDVKSQYALQREKRVRQRRAIRTQRSVRDEDSDALLSDGEQTEMTERRDALREGLTVALQDIDEEYTKLSNLIRIFTKWASNYPEEYRECFASLSLADLASILVQVDLCSTHHPLRCQLDSEELLWLEDVPTIPVGEEEEDTLTYRMVDKVFIPVVTELLDEGAYDIISTKETRSLASFYWQICSLFPEGSSVTLQLTARITKYLREGLDNIVIPILKSGAKDQSHSEDVREAVEYATCGQVRRVQKVVCNLVTFWKLEATAEPILEFLCNKFLLLLSSLQAQGNSTVALEGFGRVWDALQSTGWLERPEFMLHAAPIRDAVVVYGIQSSLLY
jgi:prefoldin subunit 5